MRQQFDNNVLRALEKWPDVPACYGWMRLDRRGRWLVKDEPISHRRAIDFLGRNYTSDDRGQWYIQNGPQRAYCSLDYTPWVYQLDGSNQIFTHTGNAAAELRSLVIDDAGDLLLETEHGIGLLHDRDLARFLQFLDDQPQSAARGVSVADLIAAIDPGSDHEVTVHCRGAQVSVRGMRAQDVPAKFGFLATPLPHTER